MLLLAERAGQAFMADKRGILGGKGQSGGQPKVDLRDTSQYRNSSYKGPAPMVLGAAQFTCHYCGK